MAKECSGVSVGNSADLPSNAWMSWERLGSQGSFTNGLQGQAPIRDTATSFYPPIVYSVAEKPREPLGDVGLTILDIFGSL